VDRVYLHGLRVDTVIGVHPHERNMRQTLLLDLDIGCDTRSAAAADELSLALDYAALADRVRDFVAGSTCQLIETLAEEVAALVIAEFGVPWLRVRLCKPGAVPEAQAVGVVIERPRQP